MRKLPVPSQSPKVPYQGAWHVSLVRVMLMCLILALVVDLAHSAFWAWSAWRRGDPVVIDSVCLDTVRMLVKEAFRGSGRAVDTWLLSPSWKANWAIPLALAWAAVAAWLIRSSRH